MKNFHHKIVCSFLLFCATSVTLAQVTSYSTLTKELQLLQKQLVPDQRVAILEVEIKDTLQPMVVVFGETDLPKAKTQIIQLLTDKNISFIDSIRFLPATYLGDNLWALTKLSVSNLRTKPDDASELASQLPMGTPIKVLDVKKGWYRVQTPELYIGWMDAGGLQLMTQEELEQWNGSSLYIFKNLYGSISDSPKKKGEIVSDIVLGDLFQVETKAKGYFKVKLPDGRIGYVRKKQCISFDDWSQSEPNSQKIITVAKQMMGSPYLWGGTSSKGVDCSGFVKMAYYSQGIILARDASQQAKYGETIDFSNISNLQPGDLLFFGKSAQRITHVGIYLGNGDFIHSSGRVHISSIIPTDPKYVSARNLVSARRILNSLNTEGIILVKDHPWYYSNVIKSSWNSIVATSYGLPD